MCAAQDPSPAAGLSVIRAFENAVSAALGGLISPPRTALLAAVSGGADSTAMLCALASLRRAAGFSLSCVHVEHGIRPAAESEGDAGAVRTLCGALGVPCKVVSVPRGRIASTAKEKGIGLEASARLYRRRILRTEARDAGAAVVLTAHTRDDMLETVLMRFLRGGGPRGLASMPVSRLCFFRPLLQLGRADVLAYLEARALPFRVDSTNADTRFLRNRIRGKLVPVLNDLFPGWKTAAGKFAGTQSLAADFIEDEARSRVAWAPEAEGTLGTPADVFFAQPEIIREEAVFQACSRSALHTRESASREVKRSNIRLFCEGTLKALDLGSAPGSGPGGHTLMLKHENGMVFLSRAAEAGAEYGFSLLIKEPGLYTLKGVSFEVHAPRGKDPGPVSGRFAGPVFFAALPFVLRGACSGDRLKKAGKKYVPADVGKRGRLVMSAADIRGIAAFIACEGRKPVLVTRGDPAEFRNSAEYVECTVF